MYCRITKLISTYFSYIPDYKTAKACYNSTITLDCINAEQDIEVISAYYGRRANAPICSAGNGTTMNDSELYTDSCKAPDVLPKLQTICDYRNICQIEINDETFPHDCTSEEPLEMFVVYQCNITKRKNITVPWYCTAVCISLRYLLLIYLPPFIH